MLNNINYYNKLGLSPNASQAEIRSAYRKIMLKVHPDVNSKEGATELFLDIQKAYTILSDPTAKTAYDAKKHTENKPSLVNIQPLYSCDALRRIEEPQLIYILIDTKTIKTHSQKTRLPLNLVLLLDLSNSMKGKRLNTLKEATIDIIKELDPEDFLTIITFNDRAQVILSPRHQEGKKHTESKIRRLIASGGTEIYRGLEAGFKQINQDYDTGWTNHIILITDGHTYGDEEVCIELAQKAARRDVGISCFGIGSEWNDNFLDEIAFLTGGSSLYIQKPKQIKQFLGKKIYQLSKVFAKNILLDIQTAPKVTLNSAFRLLPEVCSFPNTPPFSLGTLRYNTTQRILLEFLVEPVPSVINEAILANVEFTFKLLMGEHQTSITLQRSVVSQDICIEPPPSEILQAMSQLTLYRMQEKAQLKLAQGNHQGASQILNNLSSHLLAKEEDSLGKIALKESSNIEAHHEISPIGQKMLKYGTRKLLSH